MVTLKSIRDYTIMGLGLLALNKFVVNPYRNVYEFEIGGNNIELVETGTNFGLEKYVLTVTKENGCEIKYFDRKNSDGLIEKIEIRDEFGVKTYLANDDAVYDVIKTAQKQYENYLKRIDKKRKEDGLDLLN